MATLLTRKEVCFLRKIDPSTLWRWERQGLRFLRGLIAEEDLTWWLEQADAAKHLGIPLQKFFRRSLRQRRALLRAAHERQAGR